jgi:tRNA-Thr(GGU) m(6)t(6)A37 methyltransferase TsaA
MNLRVGFSTKAPTLIDMVSSRLVSSQFMQNSSKLPVGVLIEDVCTPFESLYEALSELGEAKRKEQPFEVIFRVCEPVATSSTATTTMIDTQLHGESTISEELKRDAEVLSFKPIGFLESCWKRKNGCPRQGRLTPSSRAKMQLIAPMIAGSRPNAKDALDGLDQFSHVWLIFVFHANQENRESGSDTVGAGHVRAKVHPPRLGGKSVGVYATRSPHRFVPIGLTAAKIEKIDGDTVYFSGIDLIDGTPILDIKPYVPSYDSLPEASHSAQWINSSSTVAQITFSPDAEIQLNQLAYHCTGFDGDSSRIRLTITETLLADPRSVYRKQKCQDESFGFRVDALSIRCSITEDVATVHEISLYTPSDGEAPSEDA